MKAFLASTMLAAASLGVQASNLVCNGTLMVECAANPYAPHPHGFCGNKSLKNVFVQIKELQHPPCATNCGSVSINGHDLIDGEYTIFASNSNAVLIAKQNENQKSVSGNIHRVTGVIGLSETDPSRNYWGSYNFRGTCSAKKNLF